jgi:hypothetical protein
MNSRAIALGASVIALSLTGGGQAMAAGLGEVTQQVNGHTEATVNGPASAVTVEGNVKVPAVKLPSRKSHGEETRPLDHSNATLEANRRSGKDTSEAFFGWDGRSTSLYAGQRRKGVLEVEGSSQTDRHGADATANAVAKPQHTRAYRGARDAKAKVTERGERSAREGGHAVLSSMDHGAGEGQHKGLPSPRSIGREVGNPIGLNLAGWLTLLFGGLCMAVGQLSRRRRRFN